MLTTCQLCGDANVVWPGLQCPVCELSPLCYDCSRVCYQDCLVDIEMEKIEREFDERLRKETP